MANLRIHQNLQGINRLLNQVNDIANRPFEEWHNDNLRLALRDLKNYTETARNEEFGNTIPEIAQHIEKLEDLIENVEEQAGGVHFRNAFMIYLANLKNLNVDFKELAKNVLNQGAVRRRTRGRRTHGRRTRGRRTRGRRTRGRRTRGRRTRGRKHKTRRRK